SPSSEHISAFGLTAYEAVRKSSWPFSRPGTHGRETSSPVFLRISWSVPFRYHAVMPPTATRHPQYSDRYCPLLPAYDKSCSYAYALLFPQRYLMRSAQAG